MNAIPAVVATPTPRRRSTAARREAIATAVCNPVRRLRTRRLAAALAAVLALGGLAGSAQAADTDSQVATTSSESSPWDTIEQLWAEWVEDDEAASVADDEGGSVDPETGDPKRNP